MADSDDVTRASWPNFFQTRSLPVDEALAFRAYLTARAVPSSASIQDLDAHYDQFCATWDPGPVQPDQ